MNLKLADMAIKRYAPALDDADAKRLEFFRALWGAMEESKGKGAGAYEVPSASELKALWEAGTPVFAQHAPAVSVDGMAAVAKALVDAVAASGFFDAALVNELQGVAWADVLAGVEAGEAAFDAGAYVEAAGTALSEAGLSEQAVRVAALLVSLALRTQIEDASAAVMDACKAAELRDPRPLVCPVCGSSPALASVGGEKGQKTLGCTQCGATWSFERVRCTRCGTRNQAHLHFYNIEGDDAHRIATCDECGDYMRTVYAEDALTPCSFEVEDVLMARLDALAAAQREAQQE